MLSRTCLPLVAVDRVRARRSRCTSSGRRGTRAARRRRGWGRSGSRRGSRRSACRSSGRTPARAGRPPPWRRRTASAVERSIDIVVSMPSVVAVVVGQLERVSELDAAAAGWAGRRRPCWSSRRRTRRSGAWRRVASSRFSVPLALTAKSVCGSRAAQSCEGCAAAWTTSSRSRGVRGEDALDAVRVADVERRAHAKLRRARRPARSLTSAGRGVGAEERGAHVVLDADDVEAVRDEVADGLRADQPPGACDDCSGHAFRSPGRARPRASCSCDPGEDVHQDVARASRRGRQSVMAEQRRAVGEIDAARRRAAPRRSPSTATSVPVSSRHRARRSRSSDRLTSRPPPTLTVAPSQWSGRASCSSIRSTRSSTCSRSRTCLPVPPIADVAQRPPEVVGQHPVGEDALVDLAHLPRAGDHAAAVDDRRAGRSAARVLGDRAARPRAWSRRRACARRRAGSPRRCRPPRRPGTSWSSASSKRVSASVVARARRSAANG